MIDHFKNKGVILLFLILMTVEVEGQELKKVWPNAVGSEERAHIESIGVKTALTRGIESPPPYTNIRAAAEWEEIEAITIAWEAFPCILKQIAAASISECRVIIFT